MLRRRLKIKLKPNNMFKLKLRDFLKGVLMAIGVPVLLIIQQSIATGSMTFNWQQIWMAAIGGFVAYLAKNFLTDDVKAAEKVLEKEAPQKLNPAAPNDIELKNK